jgi:NADH dehydrogenase
MLKANSIVKKIVVTGANGYIGRHFVDFLLFRGLSVVALVRDPKRFQIRGVETHLYSMEVAPHTDWFKEVDAVVHLAAIANNTCDDGQLEYKACCQLIDILPFDIKNKFIFVSSQSAGEFAPTKYGRTKWNIEQMVSKQGGVIVRPGLVYGGHNYGALFAMLCSLAKKLPVLPALTPSPRVQPIHIDDLSLALLNILSGFDNRCNIYYIASTNSVRFSDFLKIIAWYRYKRLPVMLVTPIFLLSFFSRIVDLLPFPKLVDSERIDGLLALKEMDTYDSLALLDVQPRGLVDGLCNKPNSRRALLEEGLALLSYVSGKKVSPLLARRYVGAIEKWKSSRRLRLPFLLLRFPFLIRLVDPRCPVLPLDQESRSRLIWCLDAANFVAESTVELSGQYTLFKASSAIRALTDVIFKSLKELPLILISISVSLIVKCGFMSPVVLRNAVDD